MKRAAVVALVAACSADAPPLHDYRAYVDKPPARPEREPLDPRLPEIAALQEEVFALQHAGHRRASEAIAHVQPASRVDQFLTWVSDQYIEIIVWQGNRSIDLNIAKPRIADHPDAVARWEKAWSDAIPNAEQTSYENTMLAWLLEMDGWIEIRLACPSDPCVSDGIDVHGDAPVAAAVRASTVLPVRMGVRRRVGVAPAGAGAGTAWAEPWFELAPDGALAVVPGVRRWPGIASAAAGLAASGITGLLRAAPAAIRSP